jgi:O-antigen ligase
LLLSGRQRTLSFARISLLLLGLLWVLPFLNYYHAYPLTTFYQEWSAAALGLAALLPLAARGYWRQPEIPRVLLLPLGMLLLVALQFALGKIGYFGQALLYGLYLLWAAMLMMLGRHLRRELGLAVLVTVLAAFLLAGAELNALVGILQHYRWHTLLDAVVTVQIAGVVYGNIAQPNHFADYLSLGLASLGLLYMRGTLRPWLTVLLALPLLFVLPLSGSRSSWLYLLCLAGLAYLWQRRDRAWLPLLRYSLLLLLGFGVMHLLVQLPWLAGPGGNVTTMQRLFGEAENGGIRLYLWREAWLIFTHFPWLGAGFGGFAWQHFQLGPLLRNPEITGLYDNAHNLVMQLAAETGLAGLLVLSGTLLPWLWQAGRAERSLYHWWGYGLLAVLAIHSLLEYPLWYLHFMGIAALLLGAFDQTTYRLQLHRLGRISVLLMLLLGALSLQQLFEGYRHLGTLMAQRPASGDDQAYLVRMRSGLQEIRRQALLQPYADLFLNSMLEIDPQQIDAELAYNEEVLHFVPISTVAYREALLLAQAGETEAAQLAMERAIWAYAGDFARERGELQALARKDPGHFAALLESAVRKHEEYLGAIHTK